MKLTLLKSVMQTGARHKIPQGQMFHSLDFEDEFYFIKSGYVKRSSVRQIDSRSVQAIYGPDYFFPLTPFFKLQHGLKLNQSDTRYFYEAVTDVEIYALDGKTLLDAIEKDPRLYPDLLYEAGRRLRSNIHHLENNALPDNFKRLAHHLVFLGDEFGKNESRVGVAVRKRIRVPLTALDLAEQLDLEEATMQKHLQEMVDHDLISIGSDNIITLCNVDLLKDVYL